MPLRLLTEAELAFLAGQVLGKHGPVVVEFADPGGEHRLEVLDRQVASRLVRLVCRVEDLREGERVPRMLRLAVRRPDRIRLQQAVT